MIFYENSFVRVETPIHIQQIGGAAAEPFKTHALIGKDIDI